MIESPFPFMPPDLSVHGKHIDNLMWWIHILMAVLFIGWGAFFVYTLVRFRGSRNPKADHSGVQSHLSSYLEVGVAAAEAILLVAIAIPIWADWVEAGGALESREPEAEKPLVVRVVAQQFAWNVHYPGPDGVFGRLRSDLVDEQTNALGLDPDDPASKDDIALVNQLLVPEKRPVIVQLTTKDVIHSFFLPVMRVKQDTIPGMSIPVGFEARMTSRAFREEEVRRNPEKYKRLKAKEVYDANPEAYEGVAAVMEEFDASPDRYGDLTKKVPDFQIACAQLCGPQHYKMVGMFHILSQEEFQGLRTTADFVAWVTAHIRWQMSP